MEGTLPGGLGRVNIWVCRVVRRYFMQMDDSDELLRRALLEPGASAAVAMRVGGLPLSEAVTVVFHGRRDLGSIQTYVARGSHGTGASLGADELLRVPCDLDLGEAE